MSEPRPTLYLIDGHAVAYREYFAMVNVAKRGLTMTTRSGESVGAVYRFASRLMDILEHIQPHYLAVSFDRGLSGRDLLYPEYKNNRDEMPEELEKQLVRIQDVVQAFNIPIMALDGCEADDVIGTIVRQAEEQDVNVHIISGDRDILQLLSPLVKVQLPQHGQNEDRIYDEAGFREKYSLDPSQLIDYKALVGDTSDNIPGVKGIGEKTATTLLQQYGSLDNVYANLANLKGAVQTKLTEGKDSAYLSQNLATIRKHLPIELELEACVAHDFEFQKVDELFEELEFRGLRDRLSEFRQRIRPAEQSRLRTATEVVQSVTVDTLEKLEDLVAHLNQAEIIVWDVETDSLELMDANLVGIALAVDGATGYYVPVGHRGQDSGTLFAEPAGQQLPLATVIEALRPPLTNPAIPKAAHNAGFDLLIMRRYGIDVTPIAFDTMIAEWVGDPISRFLGLKNLVRDRFKIEMTEIQELIGTGKKQRVMSDIAIDQVAPYAAADAALTYQLQAETPTLPLMADRSTLRARLQDTNQLALFEQIEVPLIPIITTMEQNGVLLDLPYLQQMSQQMQNDLARLEDRIFNLAGDRFNINSPKQLSDMLFNKLQLPVRGVNKTTQGYSTDVGTLENLKSEHPVIEVILEYRELSKLKGTYVDALPALVSRSTGRVHTSYNQTGSSTGRFSSSNPNLQNIPIRTELGRDVRRAFIAPEGSMLLSVDYSQIELRIMAHVSQDATLMAAFQRGADIHRATAAAVFGVDPATVTDEQRSFAKRVNFGLIYGMGAFRLSRDSDLTLGESQRFIENYFQQIPGVKRYIDGTEKQAIEQGYVETLLHRRRYFPNLQKSSRGSQTAQAELRAAINMPIQGSAADILKLAMLRLYPMLHERYPQTKLILQVHDELVLEVPEQDLQGVAALVLDIMQNAYTLSVPLVANAEYGKNWNDMQKLS